MKLAKSQDLHKLFPEPFSAVVLVSNKKLLPSEDTGRFLAGLGPTLFVYHNHSEKATRIGLRMHYAPGSSEALFLMPNHLKSFWGLDSNNSPYHQASPDFPLQSIITHWSAPPHPEWNWVDGSLISSLCEDYPSQKIPTNGFITRRLFQAAESYLTDLAHPIFLYGFTMDDEYINSPSTWDGHANLFEREDLAVSCLQKRCVQLAP